MLKSCDSSDACIPVKETIASVPPPAVNSNNHNKYVVFN